MVRTVYYFDDLKRKVPVGHYDDGFMPVGGRIFYIDSNSDETIKFYDSQFQEISNVAIGDTPMYYKVTNVGTSGKEKYYVYDNMTGLVESKWWGYDGITTGATSTSIGSGKSNTSTIISIQDTSSYSSQSMFTYLNDVQNAGTGINNCKDWYIGSRDELTQFKLSNLENWFPQSGNDTPIWCSTEYSNTASLSWQFNFNDWQAQTKTAVNNCFFIRSF